MKQINTDPFYLIFEAHQYTAIYFELTYTILYEQSNIQHKVISTNATIFIDDRRMEKNFSIFSFCNFTIILWIFKT